eukprot:Rmarinus@m.7850
MNSTWCGRCDRAAAVLWCEQCQERYCCNCSNEIHEPASVESDHIIFPLQSQCNFQSCSKDPRIYCAICKKVFCFTCNANVHADEELSTHTPVQLQCGTGPFLQSDDIDTDPDFVDLISADIVPTNQIDLGVPSPTSQTRVPLDGGYRAISWDSFLRVNGRQALLERGSDLRTLVLTVGVPKEHRADLWLLWSGGRAKMVREGPAYYGSLVESVEASEREAGRSVSLHPLHRVVLTYARRNPAATDFDRLSSVARFLMLYVEEEEAFWVLSCLAEDFFPGFFTDDAVGLLVARRIFSQFAATLCDDSTVDVWQDAIEILGSTWMGSLFVTSLGEGALEYLFDVFFFTGAVSAGPNLPSSVVFLIEVCTFMMRTWAPTVNVVVSAWKGDKLCRAVEYVSTHMSKMTQDDLMSLLKSIDTADMQSSIHTLHEMFFTRIRGVMLSWRRLFRQMESKENAKRQSLVRKSSVSVSTLREAYFRSRVECPGSIDGFFDIFSNLSPGVSPELRSRLEKIFPYRANTRKPSGTYHETSHFFVSPTAYFLHNKNNEENSSTDDDTTESSMFAQSVLDPVSHMAIAICITSTCPRTEKVFFCFEVLATDLTPPPKRQFSIFKSRSVAPKSGVILGVTWPILSALISLILLPLNHLQDDDESEQAQRLRVTIPNPEKVLRIARHVFNVLCHQKHSPLPFDHSDTYPPAALLPQVHYSASLHTQPPSSTTTMPPNAQEPTTAVQPSTSDPQSEHPGDAKLISASSTAAPSVDAAERSGNPANPESSNYSPMPLTLSHQPATAQKTSLFRHFTFSASKVPSAENPPATSRQHVPIATLPSSAQPSSSSSTSRTPPPALCRSQFSQLMLMLEAAVIVLSSLIEARSIDSPDVPRRHRGSSDYAKTKYSQAAATANANVEHVVHSQSEASATKDSSAKSLFDPPATMEGRVASTNNGAGLEVDRASLGTLRNSPAESVFPGAAAIAAASSESGGGRGRSAGSGRGANKGRRRGRKDEVVLDDDDVLEDIPL